MSSGEKKSKKKSLSTTAEVAETLEKTEKKKDKEGKKKKNGRTQSADAKIASEKPEAATEAGIFSPKAKQEKKRMQMPPPNHVSESITLDEIIGKEEYSYSFEIFLQKYAASENFAFLRSLETIKTGMDNAERWTISQYIIKTFVEVDSPQEINISASNRREFDALLKEWTASVEKDASFVAAGVGLTYLDSNSEDLDYLFSPLSKEIRHTLISNFLAKWISYNNPKE